MCIRSGKVIDGHRHRNIRSRSQQMKHQLTGNAGLYRIAWELSRRGWNVLPTVRNARGADLYAVCEDETRIIAVQSKALSKRADVPLGGSLEALRSMWWIVTLNANSDEPSCFILNLDEVKANAVSNTNKEGKVSYWLPSRFFMNDIYKDAWHRLDAETSAH